MSQAGLFNEEEIKNLLNENYNLKLDRDSLIKPTPGVVTEIYTRFLDEIYPKWRLGYSQEDTEFLILRCMKYFVSNYNTNYTFQFGDIVTPTRKRTTTFLNILLYIKAQADDVQAECQQRNTEWAEDQREIVKFKKEKAQRRAIAEQIATKIASKPRIEELREDEMEKALAAANKVSDDKAKNAKQLKASIKDKAELLIKFQVEVDEIDKEIDESKRNLQLLNDGKSLKSKVEDLKKTIEIEKEQSKRFGHKIFAKLDSEKQAIDIKPEQAKEIQKALQAKEVSLQEQLSDRENFSERTKLQYKIEKEKLDLDLAAKIERRKHLIMQKEALAEQITTELESIKKEKAEAASNETISKSQCQFQVEKTNKQLESLAKRINDKLEETEKEKKQFVDYRKRIATVIGKPKDITLPANRTYIKEPVIDEFAKNRTFNKI